jgi:hypothetical protein
VIVENIERKIVEFSIGMVLMMAAAPLVQASVTAPSSAPSETNSYNDMYVGIHSTFGSTKAILDEHGKLGIEASGNLGLFNALNPGVKYVDRLGDRGFAIGVVTEELTYEKFSARGALYWGSGGDIKMNLDYVMGYDLSESVAVQASYNLYEFDRGGKRHDFNIGLSYKF